MSLIFISHATADSAKTRAIIEWIVSQGWPREEIFVDFDDIGGGQRWRDALKKAASRCEAVVFLISPTWRQRDWCGAEAFAAQMLYKKIIPVLIEPTPLEAYRDLLTVEYQLIDLTVPGPQSVIDVLMPNTGHTLPVALAESGLQRLVVGLKRAGFDASTFPLTPGRKIYPGLVPLDTDDAAVFFGRDAHIARGIETLRQMRERGQSLLAILAASGDGVCERFRPRRQTPLSAARGDDADAGRYRAARSLVANPSGQSSVRPMHIIAGPLPRETRRLSITHHRV